MNKTIRMPKASFTKWMNALRSGKYKQCTGMLFDGEGYCCLGVLIKELGGDVLRDRRGQVPSLKWLDKNNISFNNLDGNNKENPGLASHLSAAEHNDNGKSFKQIANMLERRVEFTDD